MCVECLETAVFYMSYVYLQLLLLLLLSVSFKSGCWGFVCLSVCLSVCCDSERSYGSINHVHKIPPLAHMPRGMNIFLFIIASVFKIYSVISPFKKASSKWLLPFRYCEQILMYYRALFVLHVWNVDLQTEDGKTQYSELNCKNTVSNWILSQFVCERGAMWQSYLILKQRTTVC
jgi:hypothetical protein